MKVEFHPEARQEFLATAAHYGSIRPALAGHFIESVEAALLDISESPEAWAEIEQDVRRKLTRVFPYALLYTIEPEHVLVVAVMHCHRRPDYWRARLEGS